MSTAAGGVLAMSSMADDTPILIETSEQPIEMSVRDVVRWVAPGAPPSEALKFLLTCRTARLNPFLGEAYLVPMGGKWATVVSKAGYLKRAQQHPDYNGHESGIIAQTLDLRTKQFGPVQDLTGTMLPRGMVVVGGWAKVWKKGVDRPVHVRLSMTEYDKGSATWKTIPCTMIRKTALVHAIREAFAIGDSYDASEFSDHRPAQARVSAPRPALDGPANGDAPPSKPAEIEARYAETEDPSLPPAMLTRILELAEKLGMTDVQMRSVLAKRGVSELAELSPMDGADLLRKLEERASWLDSGDILSPPAAMDAPAPEPEPDPAAPEVPVIPRGPEDDPPFVPKSAADDFILPDAERRAKAEPKPRRRAKPEAALPDDADIANLV